MIQMKQVVLFDGECNLCNQSVQFIIKRDPTFQFVFASLQSPIGQSLMQSYGVPKEIDSLILLSANRYYSKSSAVLRIGKSLIGIWKISCVFFIIPVPIRNFIYDYIAKNRLTWFKQKKSCLLPSPEHKTRFLS